METTLRGLLRHVDKPNLQHLLEFLFPERAELRVAKLPLGKRLKLLLNAVLALEGRLEDGLPELSFASSKTSLAS